jgi:hypothetical protein
VRGLLGGQVTLPDDMFGRIAALKERYLAFITDFQQRVSRLRHGSVPPRVV